MEHSVNQELLDFIDASPTAWHAVETLARRLSSAGCRELREPASGSSCAATARP